MTADELKELQTVCPGASEMLEGTMKYVFLPQLVMPPGCNPAKVDALLCLSPREGYLTRLFLQQQVTNKVNWTMMMVLGRAWYTWSWNGVPADMRPTQILIGHLRAFR